MFQRICREDAVESAGAVTGAGVHAGARKVQVQCGRSAVVVEMQDSVQVLTIPHQSTG